MSCVSSCMLYRRDVSRIVNASRHVHDRADVMIDIGQPAISMIRRVFEEMMYLSNCIDKYDNAYLSAA